MPRRIPISSIPYTLYPDLHDGHERRVTRRQAVADIRQDEILRRTGLAREEKERKINRARLPLLIDRSEQEFKQRLKLIQDTFYKPLKEEQKNGKSVNFAYMQANWLGQAFDQLKIDTKILQLYRQLNRASPNAPKKVEKTLNEIEENEFKKDDYLTSVIELQKQVLENSNQACDFRYNHIPIRKRFHTRKIAKRQYRAQAFSTPKINLVEKFSETHKPLKEQLNDKELKTRYKRAKKAVKPKKSLFSNTLIEALKRK